MSGSLLSWDDYTEDENPAVAKAAKAVQQIDTTEAVKELEKQAAAYVAPPVLTGIQSEVFERAAAAIRQADHQLTYGGRLNVDDKRLLNSATDLNQLVPFKFEWAWAGYLESCNAHWMPPEIPLEKDLAELNEVNEKGKFVVGTNDRKILANMLVNHIYMKNAVPNIAWLNLYRMVENPEGRQYLLRQVFEETLTDHAISNLQESLGLMTFEVDKFTITRHLHLLEDSYKDRFKLLREYLPMMTGDEGQTVGDDNLRAFFVELAILYGFVDWIAYVTPLYQVIKLSHKTGKFNGLAQNAENMLRDLVHHQQVFDLILETGLAENGHVVDATMRADFVGRMKKLMAIQEDLISLLSVDDTDYIDLSWLMKHKLNTIQTQFGIHASGNNPVPSEFMTYFMSKIKGYEIKLHGGGGSVTAQGGGALDWK